MSGLLQNHTIGWVGQDTQNTIACVREVVHGSYNIWMVHSCLCILSWDRGKCWWKLHTSPLNAHKHTEQVRESRQNVSATLCMWRQLPQQMSKGSMLSTFQFVPGFWQDIWPLFIQSLWLCWVSSQESSITNSETAHISSSSLTERLKAASSTCWTSDWLSAGGQTFSC